jgi:hypothetical protein
VRIGVRLCPEVTQGLVCQRPFHDIARMGGQRIFVRNHFLDAMFDQLLLEEPDEHVGRHRVQLDAAVLQDADL